MPLKRILLYGAVACAVIVAIGQLPDGTNGAEIGTWKATDRDLLYASAPESSPRDASRDCLRPGEICQLSGKLLDTLEWTPTSATLAAHEELRKAIRADDRAGIVELVHQGRVLDTKPGDRILILDVSVWNGRLEGRMTTGKHAGQRVWVMPIFVKKPIAP